MFFLEIEYIDDNVEKDVEDGLSGRVILGFGVFFFFINSFVRKYFK